jgi:hypothetical protein
MTSVATQSRNVTQHGGQLQACSREEPWEFAEDITSHEQRLAREPRFDLRHDHQACEDCVNIYGTHAEL